MSETLLSTISSGLITQKAVNILRCLSTDDTYEIFLKAKEGLPRTTGAHINLNMSRKKYYSALKKLVSNGLLLRKRSGYCHSALGSLVYKLLISQLQNELTVYTANASVLQLEHNSSMTKSTR